jgi:hypothetical protein
MLGAFMWLDDPELVERIADSGTDRFCPSGQAGSAGSPASFTGRGRSIAATDYLLVGRYRIADRMAADGMCQVWRGEGVWQSDSLNGITLHQLPQILGSDDFLPNFLPRAQRVVATLPVDDPFRGHDTRWPVPGGVSRAAGGRPLGLAALFSGSAGHRPGGRLALRRQPNERRRHDHLFRRAGSAQRGVRRDRGVRRPSLPDQRHPAGARLCRLPGRPG